MILTVKERIQLLNILPAEGDILSLRLVRKLREALSFSEAEHAALKIEATPTQVKWDQEAATGADKEVEIGPKAHEIVAVELRKLSDQRKLNEQYLDLYDRFNPPEA